MKYTYMRTWKARRNWLDVYGPVRVEAVKPLHSSTIKRGCRRLTGLPWNQRWRSEKVRSIPEIERMSSAFEHRDLGDALNFSVTSPNHNSDQDLERQGINKPDKLNVNRPDIFVMGIKIK